LWDWRDFVYLISLWYQCLSSCRDPGLLGLKRLLIMYFDAVGCLYLYVQLLLSVNGRRVAWIAGPASIRSTAFVQIACRSLSWDEYGPRVGGVAPTRSCLRGIHLPIVALNQIDQSSVKYMVTSCHLSNYSDVCPDSCHDLTFTTPFEAC